MEAQNENHRASSPVKQPTTPVETAEDAQKVTKRRRRVPIACASCRLRKTKCDHIVPKNPPESSPSGLTTGAYDYIRSLEYKVKQYETQLMELQRETAYRPAAETARILPAPHAQAPSPSVSLPYQPSPRVQGSAVITAANPSLFLAGHGAINFTQLILNAMNPGAPDRVQSSNQLFPSPRDPSREMPDTKLYDLPIDARELIQRYFDFHYVITPVFHVPSIFARFELAFASERARRHEHTATLAIINMICAIATAHRRTGVETSTVQTRRLYDRAMALLGPSLFYDWSLEKVQVLLLGARYLQSSNFPDECWTVLGLAIRIAHALELHLPPPDHVDCITKEVRKRLWYACYTTDQLLCTIYGRPAATASSTFSTPLPEDLDDECIQHSRLLYPATPTVSAVGFSIHNAKLFRIMETAAALVDPPLEKIVELDESFEAWFAQVPSAFKIYEQESIEDNEGLILAMRANMVRILVHRHTLVTSLSLLSRGERVTRPADGLRANMMQNSRQICVRTAEETIRLVGHRHDRTKKAVGPSWWNLYYLFNAILIIASHVVHPEYRNDKEALAHLEEGMRMIGQMSANHTTAQRAHIFLRQLLDLVEKALPAQDRKPANRNPAVSNGHPIQHPSVSAAEVMGSQVGFDNSAPREFMQLWDSTEDLTMALGSHLQFYSSMGSGMWTWGAPGDRT
ncbi:fungal-specific transcription factor domain-containing protein [Talaromyces proteolyticus]|uniref:Fungal-specific transcription factor domain-containing protein n=1 Tax=Talaromyces proteolyticus TaxID=1131652 RepID=A0AAD4KJC6_9EURO|nr:fungal-specific transcription factor domain-containing protein [Talaromyces proteolyticus]KAH8692606.1 fungal-specific transcription factor domain-containing protein [Talaromyces proteolyticus]